MVKSRGTSESLEDRSKVSPNQSFGFPRRPPGATLAPMDTPLYRRPRRASPFARGIEASVLFCILGFSTWLFVHFTEDPAPPTEYLDAAQFPWPPDPDTTAATLKPAPPDTLVALGSLDANETSVTSSSRESMDQYERMANASPAPTSPSSPHAPAALSPSGSTALADPTRSGSRPGSIPSATASSRIDVPNASHVPLSVRTLAPHERAELEQTLQRGLVRFGYDPRRPDPEAVAARIAADPAILDLAATLGLKSADVHWLAYDYLSRIPPTGMTSPSPYGPTTLSPRNPAPRPL